MSRRDRISDFTRPVMRNRVSDSRRVLPRKKIVEPTTNLQPVGRISRNSIDVARSAPKSPPAEARQDKSKVLRRQGLRKLPEFAPRQTKKRINIRLIGSMAAVFLIVITTPVLIYKSITGSPGFVQGVKKTFATGNDLPKYLTASSIMDVAAKINVISSVENDASELQSSELGWYQKSSKPGTPGAMVLAGFVSGVENAGALRNVLEIKEGDYIQIETGDGKLPLFKVHSVRKFLPNELDSNEIIKSAVEGKEGLNLVTFTDRQDPKSPLAKHRVVVYAVKE